MPIVSDDGRQVPEELKPLHDYYEKWNKDMGGTWFNRVSEKVNDIWRLNPDLKVTQCIVIGLGSLDIASQAGEMPEDIELRVLDNYPAKIKQFITVRMTVDYINKAAHSIETYFQEPKFTELDKAYLEYHGYKVLEGDSGFDMVDSKTLLFNMNCDNELPEWPAILKAPPPVYVGTSSKAITEALIATHEAAVSSPTYHIRQGGFNFDVKPMEEYLNITNAYSFPLCTPEELFRAFHNFDIRVVKTAHKDHQPS